jgi:hypothetical protein
MKAAMHLSLIDQTHRGIAPIRHLSPRARSGNRSRLQSLSRLNPHLPLVLSRKRQQKTTAFLPPQPFVLCSLARTRYSDSTGYLFKTRSILLTNDGISSSERAASRAARVGEFAISVAPSSSCQIGRIAFSPDAVSRATNPSNSRYGHAFWRKRGLRITMP